MLHGRDPVSERPSSAVVLTGFALLGGLLQIFATVRLGLAPVDALASAAAEGPKWYLLGVVASALGVFGLWRLRRHPMVAVGVFLGWQAAVFWPLSGETTALGLAFHGESILHHFIALLCAAVCVHVGWHWIRRAPELGPLRWIPGLGVTVSAVAALVLHVWQIPGLTTLVPPPQAVEASMAGLLASALFAALLAIGKTPAPVLPKIAVVALMLPLIGRITLAWPEGLSGASVPDTRQDILMTSVVVVAFVVFIAFRPELSKPLRLLVLVLSGLATFLMAVTYWVAYGRLEDDLGGLAQSIFGFTLPYPSYVPIWKIVPVALAIFCMFAVVYGTLMDPKHRGRGVSLGLLAVAGLGLSNPQLALMVAAGMFVLVDSLRREDATTTSQSPRKDPERPMEDLLAATATRLDLPPPVILETARGPVVALRGEFEGTHLELKARPQRQGGWLVELHVGVVGRSKPDVELLPERGSSGVRPAHLLSRTHKIRGDARTLEHLGDDALDALLPFETAHVRLWSAGATVRLGPDLARLDDRTISDLLRALSRI